MDLVMRNTQTGEEKVVFYDFDFNVGSECDFEIAVPLGEDIWDFFYVADYGEVNEYAGFVTDTELQTLEEQVIVRGKTLRYYLRTSVCGWVGPTEKTIAGGTASSVFSGLVSSYYEGPIDIGEISGGMTLPSFKINRFDSIDQAITKGLDGNVYAPYYKDGEIGILVRQKNKYTPRIHDGSWGGTGEGVLETQIPRNVAVIAAGTGEAEDRIVRTVWRDGSAWQQNSTGAPPGLGCEMYFLDYPNADEATLVANAKKIILGFLNGTTTMSASNLDIESDATVGDIVETVGAFHYLTIITGKILRRANMDVDEDFTYAEMESISAKTHGTSGETATVEILNVKNNLNVGGDAIISGSIAATNIDSGRISASTVGNVPAGSYKDINVNFSHAFPKAPRVVCCIGSLSTAGGTGCVEPAVNNITTSGFTVRVFNGDANPRNPSIDWVAIGQ